MLHLRGTSSEVMKTNLFPQIETIGKGDGKWEKRWKEKGIEPWMGCRADLWTRRTLLSSVADLVISLPVPSDWLLVCA